MSRTTVKFNYNQDQPRQVPFMLLRLISRLTCASPTNYKILSLPKDTIPSQCMSLHLILTLKVCIRLHRMKSADSQQITRNILSLATNRPMKSQDTKNHKT